MKIGSGVLTGGLAVLGITILSTLFEFSIQTWICALLGLAATMILWSAHRKSGLWLPAIWAFVVSIEFCLAPIYFGMNSNRDYAFAVVRDDQLLPVYIFLLPFCAVVALNCFLERKGSIASGQGQSELPDAPSFWVVALLALAACFAAVSGLSQVASIDFADRITALQGTGYLSIFAYSGLVCAFIAAHLHRHGRISIMAWIGTFAASIYFLTAGQRGGVIYPLLIAGLGFLPSKRMSRFLGVAMLLAPVVIHISDVTSYWRTIYGSTQSLSMTLESSDYGNTLNFPEQFAHAELLATLIEERPAAVAAGIDAAGVAAGITNWIPRVMWPDKPLTTGPRLSAYFYPDSVGVWGHTSSLTSGPLVEAFALAGWWGALLLMPLAWLALQTERRIQKRPESVVRSVAYGMLLFLFGWTIWFDDLGGTVNKFVAFAIPYVLIKIAVR